MAFICLCDIAGHWLIALERGQEFEKQKSLESRLKNSPNIAFFLEQQATWKMTLYSTTTHRLRIELWPCKHFAVSASHLTSSS